MVIRGGVSTSVTFRPATRARSLARGTAARRIVNSSAAVVSGSSDESNQDPLAGVLPPGVDLGPFDPVEGKLE